MILKLCRLNSIHLANFMLVLETKGIHRWILAKCSVLYLLFILHLSCLLFKSLKEEFCTCTIYLSNILSFETLQIVSIHLALYYGCPNIQGNCRCWLTNDEKIWECRQSSSSPEVLLNSRRPTLLLSLRMRTETWHKGVASVTHYV